MAKSEEYLHDDMVTEAKHLAELVEKQSDARALYKAARQKYEIAKQRVEEAGHDFVRASKRYYGVAYHADGSHYLP